MSDLVTVMEGDAVARLRELPDESVQCCVTSPPYWGLRDYGVEGQIGLEETFDEFLDRLLAVFAEVHRVLKPDGTLWVNMGDGYASTPGKHRPEDGLGSKQATNAGSRARGDKCIPGVKPKDLIGQPWELAFALRRQGWFLRRDIIWHKPNPMPESCRDRPTTSHEYVFLLSKSQRYYYDADSIRTPPSEALLKQIEEGYNGQATKDFDLAGVQNGSAVKKRIIENARKKLPEGWARGPGSHGTIHPEGRNQAKWSEGAEESKGRRMVENLKRAREAGGNHANPFAKVRGHQRPHDGFNGDWDQRSKAEQQVLGANARSVWTITTKGYKGAHFATFPPELPRKCILAGSQPGDVVLDPFGGSGTTGEVALSLGRKAILIELNPDYCELIRQRLHGCQVGLPI